MLRKNASDRNKAPDGEKRVSEMKAQEQRVEKKRTSCFSSTRGAIICKAHSICGTQLDLRGRSRIEG